MGEDLVGELPLIAKLIMYIGTVIVAGLATAVGVLYKSKESRDKYIRESDKANMEMLTSLSKAFDIMHRDINQLPENVRVQLTPLLVEIKHILETKK